MKKLGIIGHLERSQVGEATERIVRWCEDNGVKVEVCSDLASLLNRRDIESGKNDIARSCDMVVSLGGDGSMLSAARVVGERSLPILGINLGSLGFLTEVTQDQIIDSLVRIKENNYRIEERMLLETSLPSSDSNPYFALNDVVIDHWESTSMINLDLLADDELVSSYNVDGIIISTPTGSTAYSLSVGGPIISPSLEAIAVSPISPHTLTLRPIIFPADNVLTIKTGAIKDKLRVSVDGRIVGGLESGQKLGIRRASHKIKLIKFGDKSFYSILRRKLHWGKRPLLNS